MWLLDTDTCIHLMRGNAAGIAVLRSKRRNQVRIPMLVVYELELGFRKATAQRAKKRKALDDFFSLIAVAPFGEEEARESAKVRAELEREGTPIGSIDYLIAGTARFHGGTLVTGNLGEFRRVKRLKDGRWHE